MIRVTDLIFSTVHGSRLYGLDHSESDMDIFEVTTSHANKARHRVSANGIDRVSVGMDTYLARVFEGSHQAVEALFSPYKTWGTGDHARFYRSYLEGMRVTGRQVFEKYERTIHTFCFGDFKRRRHAARLALNLADLRVEGRFNPVLTPANKRYIGLAAERHEGQELWEYLT